MNLHHLKLFLAVAETGSVTAGAQRLMISQPAVSRGIAELEAALKQDLFDRSPRGVALTDAGRMLRTYAIEIFRLENEAERALLDLKLLETGRLAIGASTTIGDYLLPEVITKFVRLHPRVELTCEVTNTDEVQRGLEDGKFDVGFTEGLGDPRRFAVTTFARDHLVFIASPTLKMRSVSLERIASHGLLMREAGSGTRKVVEDRFRTLGVTPRILASLGSTGAVKQAVRAGLGIGVVSALAIQDELKSGVLVDLLPAASFARELHQVQLPWRNPSPALNGFLKVLTGSHLLK